MYIRYGFIVVLLAAALGGCQPEVLKQAIPVSTDPMGAQIFVDGKEQGTTPATLDLARNQDHIVTLSKEGYRQEDVTVTRQYQGDTVMINAINKGVQDSNFFGNSAWGVNSGINSIEQQKQTGEAYVLTPSTLRVRLTPVGGVAAAPLASSVQEAAQPAVVATGSQTTGAISLMSVFDHQMLSRILETVPSGKRVGWTSPDTGWQYSVAPEPASNNGGLIVRFFQVSAVKDGQNMSGMYPAHRVSQSDWEIGYGQQTSPGQPASAPMDNRKAGFTALKAAAAGMPDVGGSTTLGKSSKTSESFSNGTYTKKTTKTSVSGGVSVNPLGAVQLLEDLTSKTGGN